MNLEQFSEKYKALKSPEIQLSSSVTGHGNTGFMKYLETEEKESKRRYYRMYILYAIGAVAYFALYVLNPDADLTLANRLAGVCYVLAFAMLLLISRKRYSEMKRTSFLNSPFQFLKDARSRYIFWNKRQIWLIPVLLLVNLGTSLSVSKYLSDIEPIVGILVIQMAFWSLMIFGLYMGKKTWKKKKKPILLKIDKMLAGFDEH